MTGLIVIVLIFAQQFEQCHTARDESTVGADDHSDDRDEEYQNRVCRVLYGHRQYGPRPQRQDADESQHEICPRLSFPLRLAVKQIDGTLPADLDHALAVDERENCRKQNHAVCKRRRLQCEHIIDTPSHHPQQQHLCRLAEHHAADRAGTDAEQSRKESFPEQHTRDVGFAHAQHMIQSQLGLTALHQEAVRIEQEDYREQADHN